MILPGRHVRCLSLLLSLSLYLSVPGLIAGSGIGDPDRPALPGNRWDASIRSGTDSVEPGAAVADTLRMDEILIRSTRIEEPARYQPVDVQRIDSLRLSHYRSMPLAVVLSRYSSLHIRDNGPGGLATLSQRGLSPGQTQVLWEGFPLNGLSTGLADLSVIPSGLFRSVEVSPGTPSSAFGGGSLGGTLFLASDGGGRQNGLEMMQSAGAFDSWNSQFRGGIQEGRWSAALQGIYHRAENDFSYLNRATGNEERRRHNRGRAGHLTGNLGYRTPQVRIHTAFWYFDNRNEIPGTILSSNPQAVQSTHGFRWIGGAEAPAGSWRLHLRTFLERDHFAYEDPPTDIDSRIRGSRWLTEFDFRRPTTALLLWQGGVSGGLEGVDTNNYADSRNRQRIGLRLNPELRLSAWGLRMTPTVRADLHSDFGMVVSPSLGANWHVSEDRFHLRALVSRDFNPPSFNDLYWVPGGNPDLTPERSVKLETGAVYQPSADLFESLHLTGYRIWLNDGIYWFPGPNGIWSPTNLERVDAYGLESRMDLQWNLGAAELYWTLGADWRLSELVAERFPGDQAVGRQMRYVPKWMLRSDVTMQTASLLLHLNYGWTGRRYITGDHTSHLPFYQIVDLAVSVRQEILGMQWYGRLSLNNLLDESYEIIQWYPMPGRHLEFALGMRVPWQR